MRPRTSMISAPRRATGKLGQVSGVSATPADTGGAGRQVTISFRELTAAERNGSAQSEVTYSYNSSTGQSGPIRPGQTVGGFANGAATTITVIAHSTAAPSSDASAGAPATPYGSPGTPSAPVWSSRSRGLASSPARTRGSKFSRVLVTVGAG